MEILDIEKFEGGFVMRKTLTKWFSQVEGNAKNRDVPPVAPSTFTKEK